MKNIALLSFSLFLLFSCSDRNNKKNVFRYNESKGISTLDPAFARNQQIIWATSQLFDGLMQFDSKLNITPCIAKSYEISDDLLTYTFHLRKDIYFHDNICFKNGKGKRVVATDFVYSFARLQDSKLSSPGSWIFNNLNKNEENNFNGFEAINDSTFAIYLKKPFSPFLGLLCMKYCSVVPKEAINYYKDNFGHHPVGTGAFYLKMWKEGEKLILRKNKNYFEKDQQGNKLPYLEAIAISFISDKQSEFLEFIKGNLDLLSGVHHSYKDELLSKKGNIAQKYKKRFNLYKKDFLNTEYLGFLAFSKSSILQNKYFRQAINYGFDRNKMLLYLRNNIGKPAKNGFVPIAMPFYNSNIDGYTYNPSKARELLKMSNYKREKDKIILTTTSDYADICEFLQYELSQIGIDLKIDVVEPATYRNNLSNAKIDFFRASWIADYPDVENYLSLFYSKNFAPKGPNYTHFQSEEYDKLYEMLINEADNEIRQQIASKMEQIIMDEAIVVPLFYDEVIRFTQKNIINMQINPINSLELKNVKKND